ELRLSLEDVCYDLSRFREARERGVPHGEVLIRQEAAVGPHGGFADIEIQKQNGGCDYIEVKWGYDADLLVRNLTRKYGTLNGSAALDGKLVVVSDLPEAEWAGVEQQLKD